MGGTGGNVHRLVLASMFQLSGLGLEIDGSAPKPVYGVPSEMVICDQIREASVPFGKYTQAVINKHAMGIVTRSRVSQNPFVTINERLSSDPSQYDDHAFMPDDEPFSPTGTVRVDPEWVGEVLSFRDDQRRSGFTVDGTKVENAVREVDDVVSERNVTIG